jgi:exosortase E/protease (VPEID-CTERM system)
MGLMLVFSISWLWYFRREYYFPRAFLIIPAALVLMFLLNAVRIAALVLIGDAGYPNVASVGFHSQAGWIAFNAVAFGVAVVSKHTPWLNRTARQANTIETDNPTAVYLLPLLAILAAGMLAHALSAGFDFLYPLRLVAAVGVLWAYRRHYRQMDWRFSWRAIAVGSVIFVLWAAFDHWHGAAKGMPAPLAQLSDPWRGFWMVCRAAAAVITVPIAEELAYRGYLMRIFASRNFEAVALRDVHWPALAAAAVIFGVTHGSMMIPGMLAGAAYGLLAIKTNRLGEAIGAHATTNALIAIAVLGFDQWQLW